jgi:transcriptional/translational regulatory protein YebC/TACO1
MAPTSYLFEKKGLITLEATETNQSPSIDHLLDISLDHGAEDVREVTIDEGAQPTTFELITALNDLTKVTNLFNDLADDWMVRSSQMSFEAATPLSVVEYASEEGISEDKADSVDKLVEVLEMEQDVTQVWTNLSS